MSQQKVNFCVFVIHAVADHLGLGTPSVYLKLKSSNIIDGYMLPCYDTLHTMGKEALVDDITSLMAEKGVLA